MASTIKNEAELRHLRHTSREMDGANDAGDEAAGFLKDLEKAKALSLETLELDRIRRERYIAEQRSRQVVVLGGAASEFTDGRSRSERSSPVPRSLSSGEENVKNSVAYKSTCVENSSTSSIGNARSTKIETASRPRPGQARKTSLPGPVLPPPPRRQMSQASTTSDPPDLMSFCAPDGTSGFKSEGQFFDPLADITAFATNSDVSYRPPATFPAPSSAPPTFPPPVITPPTFKSFATPPAINGAFQPFESPLYPLGSTPLPQRQIIPPFVPPRPLNAIPTRPAPPIGTALVPMGGPTGGRVSLSAVPPAPAPKAYTSDFVLKVIEKKSNENLIDLSFFDGTGYFGGAPSNDLLKSFDPLLTDRKVEDQSFKVVNVPPPASDAGESSSQYYKMWEFGSDFGTTYEFGEEKEFRFGAAVENVAPPVPVRNQSRGEQVEGDVELRRDKQSDRGPTYNRQRCSRVYKSMKAISRTTKTTILEYEAFRDVLVRLRRGFTHDDIHTNTGLVISPNLESLQMEETSVKLCIYSTFVERPFQFACDVNTSIEHIISQIACTIFDDISSINLENYVLKVHGMTEYFSTETALVDYEYVHHCLKFDEVVKVTFLDTESLQKPLARTACDDVTDVDIAVSSLMPPSCHADAPKMLSILADTLEKEIDKLNNAADQGRAKTLPFSTVIQAVKAICSTVYKVETKDIREAIQAFMIVVNYFASVEIFEDLPDEREAEYISRINSGVSMEDIKKMPSSPNIRMHLLNLALERLRDAIRYLLNTYCRSFFIDYEVPVLSSSHSITDIIAYNNVFRVTVSSIHNLPQIWSNSYTQFVIGLELYHGSRRLAKPVYTNPVRITAVFYPHILFDELVSVNSLSLCTLPRESRLCCTLQGIPPTPSDSKTEGVQQETPKDLCWAAFQIFDYNGEMLQGNAMCGMWPADVDKSFGPAVCNMEDANAPLMLISLPDFEGTVIFPPVLEDTHSHSSRTSREDFAILDSSTQQRLIDTVLKSPYSSENEEDREMIWNMRYYLHEFPQALPKVLLASHSWNWSCLPDIYYMIKEWKPMEPIDALELLLPCFPDLEVRKTAISWIKSMGPDELCDYLPQLVQALKYETYEDSPTARFLLERSLTCIRVMHHLYWLLKQNLDDPQFSRRIHLLMNSLKSIAGKAMRERMDDQEVLMEKLTKAGTQVKNAKESHRVTTLENALQSTNSFLEDTTTCLPLSPSLEVCGVNITACSYFPSNALPLKLNFKSVESGAKPIEAIFKHGDDLRQDMLALQMIRIMDKLWLKEGLNLKIVTFCCIPTAPKTGILEMVKEAETLRKIQIEHGLTGSFKDHPIAEWLHKYNMSEVEYQQAVENFTLSCAGYSVATYILGICDRHNDNIMIKRSGHIFHIDFGKFLGDSQKFGGIKRDRVPFVLTSDMAYVINGGDKPSDKFQSFVEYCCRAFNAIRKHGNLFLHLFSLMVSAGIPGVTQDAVTYIKETLWLNKTEDEASMKFTRMIQDSLKSWSTQINFFIHNLAQMRFTGEQSGDTLLSFVPRTYTMEGSRKIEKIDVVGYEKRFDPEKYYAYIILVKREGEPESFLFRSYNEFCEFHEKLCTSFPLAKYRSLPKVFLRRSNIRQVAEKRKAEIEQFLKTLWKMADEIKHCDLVYTFFHPLLRDLQESSSTANDATNWRPPSQDGLVTGEVKLSIHYKTDTLFIMVMHARNLNLVKGQDPDPYVKTYLIPDTAKDSKRKTKVARKTCHPTFMALLVYCLPLETVKQRFLQVSIWNSGRVAENVFLGAVSIDLSELNLTRKTTKWYQLGNGINFLRR